MELAGLCAVWSWSRRACGSLFLLVGGALFALLASALFLLPSMEPRRYLIFASGYLLSGLTWAWWIDDL
ncbi:hypothetical protein SAMN06297144_3406, partial [Sphingomonas guangdongensis]